MNVRCSSDSSRWQAISDIINCTRAANEAWHYSRLPASAFHDDRQGIAEQHDPLCDVESLRAEIRHLKNELERTAQERDMLRNANRIIAVTIQAQQRQRRGAGGKTHPRSTKSKRNATRPR